MNRQPRLALSLAAIGIAAVCTAPASASAAPSWKCRASSTYVAVTGQDRVEPFVANGNPNTTQASADRSACADDGAQVTGDRTVDPLTQSNPFVRTDIDPDSGPAAAQTVTSRARTDATSIGGNGTFTLTTQVAQSQANARCIGGTPVLSGSSSVVGVSVNGVPAIIDDNTLEQVGTGLNGAPVGGLVQVKFNEEERSATSLVRRAVHVRITDAAGNVIRDAVVAESSVGFDSGVCQDTGIGGSGGNGGDGNGSGGGSGDGTRTSPCPRGSEYDGGSDLCVRIVRVSASGDRSNANQGCPESFTSTGDGNCIRAIPVDDNGNSLGGSVVPLDGVESAAKSPCRNKRFGKKLVAIVGTSKTDMITGTNKSDRLFLLGGNDLVSGGRGNDCMEGGAGKNRLDGSTGSDALYGGSSIDSLVGGSGDDQLFGKSGNDRLTGSFGNDRISGSSGRDKIVGGPGNDKLSGGSGNDTFDLGTGRDRVSGGAGVDKVNAANTSRGSTIDCGPGRDTLRINRLKGNRFRGCERVFVLARKR